MSKLVDLAHLRNQVNEVTFLAEEAAENGDVVAEMNFRTRIEVIKDEIRELERTDTNTAEIAILFDGKPVEGRISIEARFAAKALSMFQDIVSKLYASGTKLGLKGARGKVRGLEGSSLRITDLARGSFGFVLEESESRQSSGLPTAMREALDEATNTITELTNKDDDAFLTDVSEINPRIFGSLTKFFRHLHTNGAELKTNCQDRSLRFRHEDIARAYKRLSESHAQVKKETWRGTLVGLSPISRSFEFQPTDRSDVLSGKFGRQFSQDYLERIKNDGITLGSDFIAIIEVVTLRKPNGETSVTYTALELNEAR
ncbi:hypothetical protein R5H32_17060 [Defluviimonas sp. D31]|uniref:hypothetical protein n=1 Tax=Defluviimonas sp. D31 TaxID=3083253 RepID=UPI00296EFB80|nr:hypothetical protein [Defluviimonas sp. D31]MDW4551074.1 hypothetical protein [Defluviimonas sp. D31]